MFQLIADGKAEVVTDCDPLARPRYSRTLPGHMTKTLSLFVVCCLAVCGCQKAGVPERPHAAGRKEPPARHLDAEAVTRFLGLLEELRDRGTMDDATFDGLLAPAKQAFAPGARLAPEHTDALRRYRTGTIGEGEEEITLCRLLSKPRGTNGRPDRDRYEIVAQYDRSGRIVDFYWDRPIDPNAETTDSEQIAIFMRYVTQGDFTRMARKGEQLFKKGRRVPEHAALFKEFPREVKGEQVRYTFYSVAGEGGAAAASLFVEAGSGRVINFAAASVSF